ncbi:Panacea domain-containing protein [Brevibacillus sp. GCM10020057]|uniref:Panacea domain-containing protein n=1 Tax=Brevibacillus sp. GCM10020057 TaxID=3317327 RepID=UPI003628B0C8
MKLLWYSDFLRYKRTRKPISGTPYWHLPYGPVPKKHDLISRIMKQLGKKRWTKRSSLTATRILFN